MSKKRIVKAGIDVLMSVAMLFLMNVLFWGNALHEWAGVGIFALFIAHHILNIRWYPSLFKGRYTPMRVFRIGIDISLLITMLLLMYSSIFISRYAFAFLPITGGTALARKLHVLGSYWGFVLMSLHLGIHWDRVLQSLNKRLYAEKYKAVKVVLFLIGLAVAVVGAWLLIRQRYADYLFLKSEFIMIDDRISAPLYFLQSAAVSGLFVFLSHYISKMLRKLSSKRKEAHK